MDRDGKVREDSQKKVREEKRKGNIYQSNDSQRKAAERHAGAQKRQER